MAKLLVLVLVGLSASMDLVAQSRQFLRTKIQEWGECKTVAITQHGGDLAIYGTNGWAKTGRVPDDLISEIREKKANGEVIQDVVVTEKGLWILLYGENGLSWSAGISGALVSELRKYNNRGETITSVAMNDEGYWLVIGNEHWTASEGELRQVVKDGQSTFGQVWTAHFNDDGLIIVYENGVKYDGEVPDSVLKALDDVEFDVYRLKFLPDGSYFMADRNGHYDYYF